MAYYLSLHFTLTTIFIILSFLSPSSSTQDPHRPFTKIYGFGDSFTDTGNTKSVSGPAGFGHVSNLPYGMTYFHHPTNRYSDGRLVIDFVTQALNLPFCPPYLNLQNNTNQDTSSGVNFAVAGATAINHAFFVKNNLSLDGTPQSIQTQLLYFDKFLAKQGCNVGGGMASSAQCREAVDDALFWVGEIGVNDYAYTLGSDISSDTIRALGVATFTQFLKGLLQRGAKKIVVQGLPPAGCLTLSMSLAPEDDRDSLGCVKSVNNQTYTHNFVLKSKLEQLRVQFPEAVIVFADYWNAYATIIKNPSNYGFRESFKACCGTGEPYNFAVFETCGTPTATVCRNPKEYINWDGVHLTEAMYKVITDMFLNGTFSNPPFTSLI